LFGKYAASGVTRAVLFRVHADRKPTPSGLRQLALSLLVKLLRFITPPLQWLAQPG
jgi:hypothetical protein